MYLFVGMVLISDFYCLYRFDYIGDKEDLRKREEDKPDAVFPLVDFWWQNYIKNIDIWSKIIWIR